MTEQRVLEISSRFTYPSPFHAKFEDVLFGLDCRSWSSDSEISTLIIRVIIFRVTQPIITGGRTDGRTDIINVAIPRSARVSL